ncbi:hypothetical protein CBR_g44342 [Chara braunii]|uniref:Anaphase-promoting complex subunit 5 n=1 Tax=Chara braunii TaxID=69332 RepID=A0A388K336_CHABU|nr:hypothetical protein CBR_g44342 [Chara braunii]|eukprot:GBG64458.1 hypothetical protein CBR_g44342 [Chara braunii]
MPTSRLTPHRVSLCILVQLYVRPRQLSYAYLPSGVRQQLALFLLHDLKGCERFSEPSLEELRDRLQQEIPGGGEALSQQLLSRLFSFNCPDDLFTFFLGGQGGVRDLLAPVSPTASPEADNERLHVDLTSTLGQFLRRSLLDFNALSFEGACRLLNDIEAYRHAVAEERGKVLQPSTGLARKGIGDIEFEDFEEGDEGEDDEYDDVLGDENEDDPDGIGDGDEVEDGVEDVDPWEDDDTEDEFGFRRESAPFMDEGRPIGRGYGLSHLAIGAARNRWRAGGAGRSERSGNIAAKAGLRKGGSSWAGSEGGGSRRASGKPPVMDGGFSFAFGKGMGGGYGEAESPRKVSVFPRTLAQLDSYLREKAVSIEREIGRVPMTALDEQLDELERLSPEMPKIHYLRYLNCLHHGDYPGAMDSLHRYFDYRVDTRGGASTKPYTKEEEAKMAAILQERQAKKEAKKKALKEEQATKLKKIEEEMAKESERIQKEEEEKLKEVEEEEEDETPLQRKRGQYSGSRDEEMEKRISESLEAEKDVVKRQAMEDEKRMEWKSAVMREKKRRVDAAAEAAEELEEVKNIEEQLAAQTELPAQMRVIARNVARLARIQAEQYEFSRSQHIAVRSIKLGFRDFARELVGAIGTEVGHRLDKTVRFCVGAIEGVKAAAPKEEEARPPRREPVKVKFPDSYSGKREENFDNWEANVKTYVHLQQVSPNQQVLIAIHALRDEAASFARSLVRAANCSDDPVAYSSFTSLTEFLKLLRERFADVARSVKASNRLQTIHARKWKSARALKSTMDELIAVPDHGVTDTQLVGLFYRAIPEALRGHFFAKSEDPATTYDSLSREVVAFEAKSASVSTFWHKDLDKGKQWKGRTISGQVKTKDSLVLTLDEGSVDEIPYDQIEWGLEEDDSGVGQGRTCAAVAAGGRPQGGRGQGQGGRASGSRFQGDQGVGGRGGNRQRCMNDLFRQWLDKFIVVYLNDILVFSRTLEEHQGHLRQVLEKLREANFKINAKKCDWAKTQVLYLGHVLDGDGVKPEDSKTAAIRDWPTPRTLTELRSFLGLANYYRKFVRNFSTIAAPLRRLLRKETIWKWGKDCTSAMKKLKQALIEYPVLKVADPSLPFVVTTDASQYGIGAALQQDDGNGYRPVEFMSARMPSEKVATSTYERELYALMQALDHWKHYLLGRHFEVYSDHETLRWLKTQAKMTPKLTRWAAEIDQYDFELKPVKGNAGQGGSILAAAGGGVGGGPGGAIGGAAGGGPGGGQGPGGGPLSINDTSVGRFQAALLSLGSMHVQFGHVREALQALNETVRIAQQNNDDVCLAHALGSLCHLLSNAVGLPDVSGAVGGGGRGIESSPRMQIQEQQQQELLVFQLLKQCLRRAQELRLPHLVAFSRLALAKFHMTHVHRLPPIGSQRPAASGGLGSYPIDVCKYLRLSALHYDVLGVSALMPAPAGPGVGLRGLHMPGGDMYGRPPPIGPMNVPGAPGGVSTSAAASAMAAAAAAAAGSGGRLGPVAGSVAKLAGTAHLLRAASWEIYGSASSARASALIHAYCYGDVASADDSCLAYVKLASQLAAHKGFAVAMASIRVAMRRFPLPANRRLRVMQLSLIHDQALNRGEMKLAEVASAQLNAVASPVDGVDMELKIEAGIRRARTLLATERIDQAAEVAYELFSRCYQTGLQIECPKVLLLFAEIYKAAGNAVVGLFYALACISQCQSFNMDVVWAAATVVLAELWLMLGASHAPQALSHLYKVLPIVLGHGGLELCGRTHLLIFKCQSHILTKDRVSSSPESLLGPLASAVKEFEAVEAYSLAAEAYYFQAVVFNDLNKMSERDEAAKNFQRCALTYARNRRSLMAVLPD